MMKMDTASTPKTVSYLISQSSMREGTSPTNVSEELLNAGE